MHGDTHTRPDAYTRMRLHVHAKAHLLLHVHAHMHMCMRRHSSRCIHMVPHAQALFHVTDWMPTLLAAASAGAGVGAGTMSAWWQKARRDDLDRGDVKRLNGVNSLAGVPWKEGDGVNNWNAISSDGPSERSEIAHAAQADGSLIKAWALRMGEMKIVYGNRGMRTCAQETCTCAHACR